MNAIDRLMCWTLGVVALGGAASCVVAYLALARDVVRALGGTP